MKRLGTVIIFAKGTTEVQAEAALQTLRPVLAADFIQWPDLTPRTHLLHQFEDRDGHPTWYIP